MKVSLDWVKDYVTVTTPAEILAERLTMVGLEVKAVEKGPGDDRVLEIEITSNRPDWLSHVGVARELGALFGRKLKLPEREKSRRRNGKALAVEIAARDLCPYYSACLLEGVEAGPAPDFMCRRLEAVGLRPVNLVVDVTNYVLLEMGQPLHAFDWDRLSGKGIFVRRAKEGEQMRAINGEKYALKAGDLAITDYDHPVAIAGVMGGIESEVGPATRNILLESAYFSPPAIRRTSKRLGLVSESSYRFERGVDPAGVDAGRERAIYLIRKHARRVASVSPVHAAGKPPAGKIRILFPLSEVKRILGVAMPPREILAHLRALGLETGVARKGTVSVSVPSYRRDLTRPVDLVEEVARLHGYDAVPESLPQMRPLHVAERMELACEGRVRELVRQAGFHEAITFSLVSPRVFEKAAFDLAQTTRIVNPQNKELTLMRPTLMPSLLEVVKTNVDHQSSTDLRFFEIAHVFGAEKKGGLPPEELTLGLALAGSRGGNWLDKGRKHTLFDLKGVLEAIFAALGAGSYEFNEAQHLLLGTAFSVAAGGETMGVVGKAAAWVHEFYDTGLEVFLAEMNLPKLFTVVNFKRGFQALPKFPASRRDIAVILPEHVRAGDVVRELHALRLNFLRRIEVLDLYQGGQIPRGKKSLAFSMEYRSDDHTLTSGEINDLHARVVECVTRKFSAILRA